MRTHTLVFAGLTSFLVLAGVLGKAIGLAVQTWPVVFAAGSCLAMTYLFLAALALSERARALLLRSKMKNRMVLVGSVYAVFLAGIILWISAAGSVEALPIFPAFLAVFYGWILAQAYFIAAPVTHALRRVEDSLSRDGSAGMGLRTLGAGLLFTPIAPLVYSVLLVSSWLSMSYQGVADAGGSILLWTVGVVLALLLTFFLVVSWSWPVVRRKKPQTAVFVAGTFALVWAFLLYRATFFLIGYLSQTQPANAVLDIGLMIVSVFGAMQTFASKTASKAERRWGHAVPFLVFSFGAIYAVAQLYFILQIPFTPVDLSLFVNATVLVSGIFTMLVFIRRHLSAASSSMRPSAAKGADEL